MAPEQSIVHLLLKAVQRIILWVHESILMPFHWMDCFVSAWVGTTWTNTSSPQPSHTHFSHSRLTHRSFETYWLICLFVFWFGRLILAIYTPLFFPLCFFYYVFYYVLFSKIKFCSNCIFPSAVLLPLLTWSFNSISMEVAVVKEGNVNAEPFK